MFVVNILSFRRNISDFLILEWHHFFPFIIFFNFIFQLQFIFSITFVLFFRCLPLNFSLKNVKTVPSINLTEFILRAKC